MITLKQLKEQLAMIDPKFDSMIVQVWLPGSYISLNAPFVSAKGILMEGNVIKGSALEAK